MKFNKSIVFLLLLCLLFTITIPTYGTEVVILSVGDSETSPEETVTIPISLDSNPGFVSMSVSVTYDTSALTLISCEDTGLIAGATHSPSFTSPYTLTWENDILTSNIRATGTIVYLTFLVNENAAEQDYSVIVRIPTDGILDANGNEVLAESAMGTITVTTRHECTFGEWEEYSVRKHVRYCTECDEREFEYHSWDDGIVIQEPSFDEDGIMRYTCEVCGATDDDTVAPLAHSYETRVTAPTCTEEGYTTYTCEECGYSYVGSYVDALGHNYQNGTCTRCGAEDEQKNVCGDNLTWTLDNGVLTISGTGAMYDYEINGAPWCDYENDILSVVIEKGVTSIGEYAFYKCSNLTSITIPEGVTSIGVYAFYDCISLTSITIPNGVTSIDDYVFLGCSGLTSITIPNSVTSIGKKAFAWCSDLLSITLPDSVTSIGRYAFEECSSMTSITIPESVTSIGSYAFHDCGSLWHVLYTGTEEQWNAISIGSHNSELTDATRHYNCTGDEIVDGVCTICNPPLGIIAQGTCGSNLTWTLDENGVLTISGTGAMYDYEINGAPWDDYENDILSVVMEKGVTSIGEWAFFGCSGMTSISIPKGVTSIGLCAFNDCSALTSITIPESITSIGSDVFAGCSELTHIWVDEDNRYYSSDNFGVLFNKNQTELIAAPGALSGAYAIPGSVTRIGDSAFYDCIRLTSVTIPDSVTSFGGFSFRNCSSLTNIVIPKNVTSIEGYAFYGCSRLTSITIPESVTSIGSGVFQDCSNLTHIWVDEDNRYYSSDNFGVLFNKNQTELIAAPGAISGTYVIPDSVTQIGHAAFDSCSSMTGVTIGKNVAIIDDWAFYWCISLTSIVIPDSVTSIYDHAFEDCRNLDHVLYMGTEEAWNAISIDNYNESLTDATRHYNCTGDEIVDGVCTICNPPVVIIAQGTCGEHLTWTLSEDGTLTISGTGAMNDNPWAGYRESILTVVIGEGITCIDEYAFNACSKLQSVVILGGVTIIEEGAFNNCNSLQCIVIPESVTTIGAFAFAQCDNMWHVLYAGTLEQWCEISVGTENTGLGVGLKHFECTGDEVTDVANKVCTICEAVCEHIWAEATCTEPKTCTLCGETEGYELGHNYLATVIVMPTCTEQGYTTYVCDRCGDSYVGSFVDALGHVAGSDECLEAEEPTCEGWGKMVVKVFCAVCDENYETREHPIEPLGHDIVVDAEASTATCTTPGATKGEHCTRCDYIVESVAIPALGHNYRATVIILPTCTEQGYTTYVCDRCSDSYVGSYADALGHDYVDGVCRKCGEEKPDVIIASGTCGEHLTWTLSEDGTLTISGTGAMDDYEILYGGHLDVPWATYSIKKVVIENGVTSIGNYAFTFCWELTSIAVPDSVISIGDNAFQSCENLTSITIPDSVTSIGSYAFDECSSLTSIAIPDSVTGIGDFAFQLCSDLISVTIGDGVTSIGYGAFSWCSRLGHVLYKETEEQWNAIAIDGNNSKLTDATRHYNCTGDEIVDGVCTICNPPLVIIAQGTCGSNLTWTLTDDGVLTIGGTGSMSYYSFDYDWESNSWKPSYCTNAPWYDYRGQIEIVVITEGVSSISQNAFRCCWAIEKVYILSKTVANSLTCVSNSGHLVDNADSIMVSTEIDTVGCFLQDFYTVEETVVYDGNSYVRYDFIADGVCGENLVYKYDRETDTTTVSGTGGTFNYEYSVEVSGNASPLHGSHIIFEEGVTTLGSNLFDGGWFESVVIPGSMTGAGEAFLFGAAVKTIYIYSETFINSEADKLVGVADNLYIVSSIQNIPDEWLKLYFPYVMNVTLNNENFVQYSTTHTHNYEAVVTEPTYTSQGYTTHTCTACGDSYVDSYTDPLVPEESVRVTVSQVSAQKGDTVTVIVRVEENVSIQSAAINFQYDSGVLEFVKAKWNISGILTNVDEEKQNAVFLSATPVDVTGDLLTFTFKVKDDAPAGDSAIICEIKLTNADSDPIGVDLTQGGVTIVEHNYEAVVTAPTCTEQGYTTHTCTICGDSYVDAYVDATGHSFGEWIMQTPATCTVDGRKVCVCACGATEYDVIPAVGHSYNALVTAPSCTAQGYTTYNCTTCGHSYVDDYVDALGHSEEILPSKDATCTETGLTEGKKCSVCGEILMEQEVIAALGHSYETVITEPTCTEQGYTTYTCACGDSYVGDYVDALGHDYESVVTEPTYTAQGYTTHTCINCGDSYVDNYTAPLVPETDVKVTVGTVSGNAGDTVEVYLTLEKAPALKILAVSQIVYDTEHLTFVSGQWLRDDSFTDTFSKKNMNGLQLFEENTDVNGEIFKLTFTINEDAPAGEYAVSCVITAKQTDENGDDLDVLIAMESGKIVVKDYLLGDVDGNEKITTDDAIYLLYNIMFGDGDYPVNQKCDFDGNGKVNTDDAIYLLYYIMFGETDYPLHG